MSLTTRWSARPERVRGRWPLAVAVAGVASLVVVEPDRGDVAIYRHAARAAVSTGAVYSYLQRGHGFTYPPFAALALSPLAQLSTSAMWGVLVLAGAGALVVVLALSLPGLFGALRARHTGAASGVAVLVVSEPVVTTLRFGQVDLLLAAMVMTDLLLLRRGVLVGLAAAVKLTPGVFVVLLLARRRYREAGVAIATFAACVLVGLVALPRPSVRYWTHNALAGTGVGSFTTVGNQSIHGVVSRVLGAGGGTAVWLLVAPAVLVWGVSSASRSARAGHDVLAVGTAGVTACLVSPVSWPHHWVWFVPLLCGLARLDPDDSVLRRWVAGAAGFAVVSQFVALKAVGLGYVPLTVALLVLAERRLRSADTTVHPDDVARWWNRVDRRR